MTLENTDQGVLEFDQFCALLERTNIFVLDTETKKRETFDGRDLLGVALGVADGFDLKTYYCDPDEFKTIHHLLQGKEMIGFNLAFDLQILENNDYIHDGFIFDVMIASHLCNENEYDYSLDALSRKYLKVEKGVQWGESTVDIGKLEKIYGWDDIPKIFMAAYAEQDVRLTYRLAMRIRGELEKQELTTLYKVNARYVRALQHIMSEGILVDWNLLDQLQAEGRKEMDRLEAIVGFEPSKRKLLEELLYETLKLPALKITQKGQRAQDTEALNRLISRFPQHTELLRAVLRWRNLAKADSTWYNGFKTRRTAMDRIHPGLKQHGTATGRLSSAAPNLQQIPRDAERVKRLFVDPPGQILVELDYAGVELRLGSYYGMKLGHDPKMFELLKEGLDAHHATAESIGSYDQISDRGTARQVGKTSNFSFLYGVGAETFMLQLYKLYGFECSMDQAEQWKERWHGEYPGFRRVNELYAKYHKRNGYVETWNKRRQRIVAKPFEKTKHHIAFNRVVQGGCSQILMQATIQLSEQILAGRLDARICNSIHDSLWIYLHPETMNETTARIIEVMEGPASKRFGLPFTIDAKALNRKDLTMGQEKHGKAQRRLAPTFTHRSYSTSSNLF